MMSQMRSREQAEKYLRQMPAETRVALLRLGNELQFVQGFTTDPEILIAAMTDMKNTVMTAGAVNTPSCYARIVKNRLTLEALRQIGAMVEGIKGRKNVLWFTGPMEVNPSTAMGCGGDAPGLDETLDMLTAGEVTVNTINPNVPCMTPGVRCEYGGVLLDREIVPATGGEIYGGNDMVGNLAKAVERGSNYYSLTYVPSHGNDGYFHHITVKVDRPGLELAYRPGYGADDLTKARAESRIPTTLAAETPEPEKNTMVASMARFAPVATQVVFDVKVAPTESKPGPTDAAVMGFPVAEVKDKPMVRYDVLYSFPANEIAFTDGQDGVYRGSLEFDVVASDVFGKLVTSVSRTMPLTLSVDEYAEFVKTPFQFAQQIDLPAGQMYVRVGALDGVSKKVGTVEVPLKVAKGEVTEAGR
jgi:VWFA-related protein